MIEGNRDARLYGTVKVGDRGQVVIPAEARKELNIKPGDLLFVMAGRNRRAVALVKANTMRELAEKIMQELEVTGEERPET
jgi:AbrB family looped-hinge helix DNA binding protein